MIKIIVILNYTEYKTDRDPPGYWTTTPYPKDDEPYLDAWFIWKINVMKDYNACNIGCLLAGVRPVVTLPKLMTN